jgi:hypothetical protein
MFKKILAYIITLSILAFPGLLMAEEVSMSGLVPVCNTEIGPDGSFTVPCDFDYFMTMLNYIIDWSVKYLVTPIFAILFIYAGFLYIGSAGNPNNKSKAKKIIKNALLGYLIILSAWLVVDTILKGLGFTGEDYLTNY